MKYAVLNAGPSKTISSLRDGALSIKLLLLCSARRENLLDVRAFTSNVLQGDKHSQRNALTITYNTDADIILTLKMFPLCNKN